MIPTPWPSNTISLSELPHSADDGQHQLADRGAGIEWLTTEHRQHPQGDILGFEPSDDSQGSEEAGGATYLIGTDAAAEGVNLQLCWLMVIYDIPWNPARLEQRMGPYPSPHCHGREEGER